MEADDDKQASTPGPTGTVLALDLGCTKAIVAVARGDDGVVLGRRELPTRVDDGAEQAVERIAVALREVAGEAGVDVAAARGIGIGAPGPLARLAGVLQDPPQMPWGQVPLVAMLADHLGELPWRLDNDCKVGGIGEHRYGAGIGTRDMVYLGVGTGIGGCVIVDDEVIYGASDNASELGHLVVWMGGPECGCGSRGCLEGIASGSGLERRARLAIGQGRFTSLPRDAPTGADIAAAVIAGDPLATELWRDAREALASATASMMSALSPELIVIGGGIAARNGDAWVASIADRARALAFGPNAGATRIVGPALGADSVLRGAIALAIEAAAAG